MSLTDRHGQHIGRDSRRKNRRSTQASLPARRSPPGRPCPMPSRSPVLGIDLHPARPHRSGQHVGQLLHPRQIRDTSHRQTPAKHRAGNRKENPQRCRQTPERLLPWAPACSQPWQPMFVPHPSIQPWDSPRAPLHQPPCACTACQKSSSVLALSIAALPVFAPWLRRGTIAARSMASKVAKGRALATSPPSWCARPSSTSGIGRVSCSGETAGGARLITVCKEPDSGMLSTHDSSSA